MTENHNRINIILIGNTGAGKSQLGNSILQNEFFKVGHTFRSETPIKNDGFGTLNNLELRVIDTKMALATQKIKSIKMIGKK